MGETKCRKELDAVVRMCLDGKRDDLSARDIFVRIGLSSLT